MLRKTVIITGAAGGIGLACAKEFAKAGYNLALTFHVKDIDLSCKEFENVSIKSYKIDISKPNSVVKTFDKIFNDFDYVDCLIANAGICEHEKLLIDKEDEEIENVISTNLLGTILCDREALKRFVKQKHGNIINIASINGEHGCSCTSVYSATKAGIIALTQSLSNEYGQQKIRINSISPGYIDTPMTACYTNEEVKSLVKQIPLKRVGKPEEIAQTALFLASDNASYITGANISVNGGAVDFQ